VNVREYFEEKRDSSGRAWLDSTCWIERAAGHFRLGSSAGVVLVAADDELESARSSLETLKYNPPPDSSAVKQSYGNGLFDAESTTADQFDDFHGRGAWPGSDANDAEASDFEDTLGDIGEEGWDHEPDDRYE
jgi:hypothetical protein